MHPESITDPHVCTSDGDSTVHVAYNRDYELVKSDQNCYQEVKLESKETTLPILLMMPTPPFPTPTSSSLKRKKEKKKGDFQKHLVEIFT